MSLANKKKVICHIPTGNQFENIKPIEVKCFTDENQVTNETLQKDGTATMMTIVPQSKRPISAPAKKQIITPITDMVTAKPIRHLAILPSSRIQSIKDIPKHSTNLSETFTMYDGPSTTPNVARSLDDTITLNNENEMSDLNNCEIPLNIEINTDNNTTMSSVCELVNQPKLQQKPHSLIGRYQISNPDNISSKPPLPPPSVHIATVYYGESKAEDNKQVLIQQFYTQLEKMKTTFNLEQSDPSHQITTNTLTFDDGQVKQTSATNELKEKIPIRRISSATVTSTPKRASLPKKQKITKISTRIQSAPVMTTIQTTTTTITKTRNSNPISVCKQHRNEEKKVLQKKKDKSIRRVESAPPINRIEIHGSEVTLLPHEEEECQKMYEKLQRLQPDGVCVNINTLRRALYPPVGGTTTYSGNINHLQTPAPFKSYRSRTEEIPQSWIKVDDKYVSKYIPREQTIPMESTPKISSSDNTDIDRIVDQVKKHAAINYSYYTRTK